MGHDVVMAPTDYCYFDYFQSACVESEPDAFGGLVTVEDVYGFEPVPEALAPELLPTALGAFVTAYVYYLRGEYLHNLAKHIFKETVGGVIARTQHLL
mgnify:CR=1 FL=1